MYTAAWGVFAAIALIMNLFTFLMMGADKRRARHGNWRIPEKRLFLCAACFGALGGVLGMRHFRHKTKHLSFRILFPLFLILQIAAIAAVLIRTTIL